jgi:hypothetical protein
MEMVDVMSVRFLKPSLRSDSHETIIRNLREKRMIDEEVVAVV